MSPSAVLVLLRASVASHRGRLFAAAVAVALAAAVLLAALLGQRAARAQAPRAAQALLGPADLHLAATDTLHPFFDPQRIDEIKADPRVASVRTAVSVRAVDLPGTETGALDRGTFYSLGAGGTGGWVPGRRDNFLAWAADGPRGAIVEGRWPDPAATDPIEVALPRVWGQKIGSWRRLESDTGVHRAVVVGVIGGDAAATAALQGVRLMSRQISRAGAERLAGHHLAPSDARIVLHHPEDRAAFVADWTPRFTALPGRVELWTDDTIRDAALNSPAVESARVAVLTAVLLGAACVVCIALGVQGSAVRERAAQLALLRALGAGRGTLVAVVLAEALLLTTLGLTGAVAVTWGLLTGVGVVLPFLRVPATPDLLSVAVTGGVILAGVFAGSAWPALVAAGSRPGEVAARGTDPARAARSARRAALLAAVVAGVVAAGVLAAPSGSLERARAAAWVGVPGLCLAAVLLAPLAVRAAGFLFARPVAWLTRTDSLVLADQVAGDGPRSAGAVVAVAVGLGGFLCALCWGASMLDSFVIDPGVPRWLVSVHPYGLDRAETERALASPELRGFQPLTLFDTRLGGDADPVPTLVMGVDPGRALGDGPDALPFRFLAGDPSRAAAELATGGACLASDWFATSAGVAVGDTVPVAVPGPAGPADRVYRVAGVVELRGWRMLTKQNKVRLRGDKHRVLVVLDADAVRRDFPVSHANYLLGNSPPGPDGRVPHFRGDLPERDALARSVPERDAVEAAVAGAVDLNRPVEHRPDGGPATRAAARAVQVDDLDRTRSSLLGDWGGGTARAMGCAPLVVLALSLLSVTGALVASLRARAQELGVLRSCGLTRFGVMRLALAESLLLGLAALPVAAALGGGAALVLLEVTGIVSYRLDFTGIRTELTVPWGWLWPGWALTAVVCGLAAVWAGWRIGRTPPAFLLTGAANRN